MRVPNTGRAERERQALVQRFEKKLRYFQSIPPSRREAECADAGEETCRSMLADLRAPGYERPQRTVDGAVTLMTMDEWLENQGHSQA